MAELTVENTYAQALYDAANEAGNAARVFDETKELINILEKNQDFKAFLVSPAISAKDKKKVLDEMFEGHMADELLNFLCLLVDKRRITNLEGMMRSYEKIYNHLDGIVDGVIYSVKPLSDEQLEGFSKEVAKLIGENIKLHNKLDESLIAGVKILIDGKIIDASYRNELNKIALEIRK